MSTPEESDASARKGARDATSTPHHLDLPRRESHLRIAPAAWYGRAMSSLDVVIVAYNSREELRACVEPLAAIERVHVIVVDNASTDGSLDSVANLQLDAIRLDANGGFAHGCNVGWRAGDAPYVIFLNPDARIDAESIDRLVAVLSDRPPRERSHRASSTAMARSTSRSAASPGCGRPTPRRSFSTGSSPRLGWTDELIRDPEVYARPGSPDWVSGACILVRRSVLEELDGLDQGFFMYCEDIDLCRRLRNAGHQLLFEPSADVVHLGGASAPRASLLPVLGASRLRYAAKHRSRFRRRLEQLGIALGALTHMIAGRGGRTTRAGHPRALRLAASRSRRESYPFG